MKTDETAYSAAQAIFYALKDHYINDQSDFCIGLDSDGEIDQQYNTLAPNSNLEVVFWDTSEGWHLDADADDVETTTYWDKNEHDFMLAIESHVIEVGIENSVTWADEE